MWFCQRSFLFVLLFKEIILILFELFWRSHSFDRTDDMTSDIDSIICSKITLKCLAFYILVVVVTEETVYSIDRLLVCPIVMWCQSCNGWIEFIWACETHARRIKIKAQILWWILVPRWRPLILASLYGTRISSLPRISPRIHLLNMTLAARSFWTLFINIKMVLTTLKLILFMEWILAHLLILRIEAIECCSLMEKGIDHACSHTTTSCVCGRALVELIAIVMLRDELLYVSLTLSWWATFTSTRDTWQLIS